MTLPPRADPVNTPFGLGLFLSSQHRAGDDLVARFGEHLEQVELAREAGFRTIMAGQHFLTTDLQMF